MSAINKFALRVLAYWYSARFLRWLSNKSSVQKKLIAHLHWIWPALGLDGLDMKDSDLKNHVLGSDGDSQIVLSCLTSCLQFWLRFLATWNILEGLEKYDKWYIILSHSRCSYHFWQLKHVDIDFWPTPIWEQPLRDGIDIWWYLQRAQWILASYASIQLIQEALVVYSIQACSDIFPSRSELQKSKLSMNRFAICFPDFTWSIAASKELRELIFRLSDFKRLEELRRLASCPLGIYFLGCRWQILWPFGNYK